MRGWCDIQSDRDVVPAAHRTVTNTKRYYLLLIDATSTCVLFASGEQILSDCGRMAWFDRARRNTGCIQYLRQGLRHLVGVRKGMVGFGTSFFHVR